MSSSSSSSPPKKYHVFLSFRGEDTRHNFTSHLLKALEDSGIQVFFDDKQLKKGHEISPALLKAIIASTISIVILSEDYASSRSCLAELSQIMDCERTQGQIVLPIFYHVDPSDVRNHRGSFKKSFDEHLVSRPDETKRWKDAFTEVGKSKGWHIVGHFSDRSEPAYIKDIVKDVIEKLYSKSPSGYKDQSDLVGIDDPKKEVMFLLRIPKEETRIIGIWGMGGIGKTTLAQAIYDQVSSQFDSCCFLHNVRQKIKEQGMESLRDKLLSTVLRQGIHVDTPSIGSLLTQERLRMKRVFVVLDDISDYEQIAGLGVKYFGLGSKIILTSRDKQVLTNGVNEIYEVKRLNGDYSRQLFSKFAFQQDQPVIDFQGLPGDFAKYAGGIPLALKVLGCALYKKHKDYWKSMLDKLKEYPDPKIFDVLKISFDALDDPEKNIFLDIACFFQEESKENVTEILNSCYKGAFCGISNLVDKGLIYNSYSLSMHDLLREMGWKIVRQESEDPGKRSRLWNSKDVYPVLKNSQGTESIKGISLDLSEIGELQLCPTIFEKMVDLRIIKFYYPSGTQNRESKLLLLDEGLKSLPDELRYLRWDVCPLKSFPSNFSPQNLVELKLTHCNIEQLWNGDKDLVNLREINVENCKYLTKIPNLLRAVNIRKLKITLCESLVELPCLNHLTNLEDFRIIKCPITKFPEVPVNLKNLVTLKLTHCNIEQLWNGDKDLVNLREINVADCKNLTKIPNLLQAVNIRELKITLCRSLVELPCLNHLTCLKRLTISRCPISKFPEVPVNLNFLDLSDTRIGEVPSSIGRLENLGGLIMSRTMIQNLPTSIAKLDSLICIYLSGCPNITNFPNVPERIQGLELDCTAIEEVPSSISRLECLYYVLLVDCKMLKSISGLPPSLYALSANGCKSLKKVTHPCTTNDIRVWSGDYSCCFGLNPEEIDKIVAYALHKSKCLAKYEFFGLRCCVPGNEISERFENRSDSFSITVKLGSNRCGHRGRFLGFVVCLVLDLNLCRSCRFFVNCEYQLKAKFGDYCRHIKIGCKFPRHPVEPYEYPMEHMLISFDDDMLREDKQYEEASFQFDVVDDSGENTQMEVIKCGVHVFYVDAESSDDSVSSQTSSSGSLLSLIEDDGKG